MQYLLAGLGNPGFEYERTRHNVGFRVVSAAGRKWGAEWKDWQRLGEYAKVSVCGHEVFLLKPSTYMNESGRAVSSLSRFYKIPPQNCLICFDDVSLEIGTLRLRKNGSAGGQKGMKSVIEQLGTQDIPRLRLGIGPQPDVIYGLPLNADRRIGSKPVKIDLAKFVLSCFTQNEEEILESALEKAVSALEVFLTSGIEKAMNRFN
jgi:PTH1 family peptidyl-tRNA hydrolase